MIDRNGSRKKLGCLKKDWTAFTLKVILEVQTILVSFDRNMRQGHFERFYKYVLYIQEGGEKHDKESMKYCIFYERKESTKYCKGW